MKIFALVTDAFGGRCGIAKFNRDLLTALCGDAAVTKVVALPRLMPDAPGELPEKLAFVTSGVGGKLRYVWAVLQSAIGNRQSAIILCGHLNLLPLAFLAKCFNRAPIVLVVHGVEAWTPPRSWLTQRLVARVDAVIAVSEFTRRKFLSWAAVRSELSFVLPNSVNLARFTPGEKSAALVERYGLRGKKVLLTVARLSAGERYKGVDEVLEVLPELVREIPELAYVIVGDGDDRARLEAKVSQLSLRERVKFAGWIANDETAAHYRLADAFVMPGRGEGFGIVYLEAMACGVPVVASTVDASGEVVRGCAGATLADPDQPATIRDGILRALALPRGATLAGAEKFSLANFNRRCGEIVATLRTKFTAKPSRNVLVFRIGHLGDTAIALPAMWAARKHFADARFTLLCDRHPGKVRVVAADLLRGAGIFDAFESYVVGGSRVLRPLRLLATAWRLRRMKFDMLVYLAPSSRTAEQVARDRNFFALAGIKNFVGMKNFPALPKKISNEPLGATLPESDLLLARLAADGLAVPPLNQGSLDLRLGDAEQAELDFWLAQNGSDGGRVWLGVGPGSKMAAKRWPEERFCEVVAKLIAERDVWPVIFGGPEDAAMAARLLAAWGCGFNAAGALSLRGATAALRRCQLYVGNDTGTMHLAAAAGVSCVAIFSSREWPGMWFPYGVPQKVFRTAIECEGCALEVCAEKMNECLNRIGAAEVSAACMTLLTTGK